MKNSLLILPSPDMLRDSESLHSFSAYSNPSIFRLEKPQCLEIKVSHSIQEKLKNRAKCDALLARYRRIEQQFHTLATHLEDFESGSSPHFVSSESVRIKVQWLFSQQMDGEAIDCLNLHLAQGGKIVNEARRKLEYHLIHLQQYVRSLERNRRQLAESLAQLKKFKVDFLPPHWPTEERAKFKGLIHRLLKQISLLEDIPIGFDIKTLETLKRIEKNHLKARHLLAQNILKLQHEKMTINCRLMKQGCNPGVHHLKKRFNFLTLLSNASKPIHPHDEKLYEPSHQLDLLIAELAILGNQEGWREFNQEICSHYDEVNFNAQNLKKEWLQKAKDSFRRLRQLHEWQHEIEEMIDSTASYRKEKVTSTLEEIKAMAVPRDKEKFDILREKLKSIAEQEKEFKEEQIKRRAMIKGFHELGYIIDEECTARFLAGAKMFVNKPRWGEYHIEIATDSNCTYIEMNLIRFSDEKVIPLLPELQRKWERSFQELWGNDYLQWIEKMEALGMKIRPVKKTEATMIRDVASKPQYIEN